MRKTVLSGHHHVPDLKVLYKAGKVAISWAFPYTFPRPLVDPDNQRRPLHRRSRARLPTRLEAYLCDAALPIGWKDPARPEGPRTLRSLHDDDLHARRGRRTGGSHEGAVAAEEVFRISYGRSGGSEKGVFSTSLDASLSAPFGLTDVTR